MKKTLRTLACVTAATAMAAAFAPGAYAGVEEPPPCDPAKEQCEPPKPPPETKSRCNSGNGNGSDAVTFVVGEHCYGGDPGNSYNAGNKGGDEVPPGESNPGGNNVAP